MEKKSTTNSLDVFGLSDSDVSKLKQELKLDLDSINLKDVCIRVKKFLANEQELSEKAAWEQKETDFKQRKITAHSEIKTIQELFESTLECCDRQDCTS